MDAAVPRLFTYILQQTKAGQAKILVIVLISFPFYFVSLDLPKQIISNAIQGKLFPTPESTVQILSFKPPEWWPGSASWAFEGFKTHRLEYLFFLSGVFLFLVLSNGYFKYTINIQKGALGERFVQSLRLTLFTRLLTTSPHALHHLKPSEAATILKDEVEPIGGFVGDALVQPLFLGGQALTALLFIVLQSPQLGLIAVLILIVQLAVIPRLRRQQMKLGAERQKLQRAFAGKVGEVVECLPEIGSQGGGALEQRDVSQRLETLYHVRFRLFERKFAVKFLNNLLAQLTPFLFYTVGGYYALNGVIDIGQLVAVIAAYRDLPPPLKELIDWDQQRMDVDAKFRLVSEQFPQMPISQKEGSAAFEGGPPGLTQMHISLRQASVHSRAGDQLLTRASLELRFGLHVGIRDLGGESARTLGHLLGGRARLADGRLLLADHDFQRIPTAKLGEIIGYADGEPTLFDGSLYDNIIYPLRSAGAQRRGEYEACSDAKAGGLTTNSDLDARLLDVLKIVSLDKTVLAFGLARRFARGEHQDFIDRVVIVRQRLREAIIAANGGAIVEPFDPERYTDNASIGDNILFGVATAAEFEGLNLASQPLLKTLITQHGLEAELTRAGERIATIMLEIFSDIAPDNVLFENFALVPSHAFPLYEDILGRRQSGLGRPEDQERLIGLAFLYIEPRHRLGLLDSELKRRLLSLRHDFRRDAGKTLGEKIEFYDPNAYCAAASLQENLLFGRVVASAPGASAQALDAIVKVIEEEGLLLQLCRLGLEQPVGYGGRLLYPATKTAVALARNLIKFPQILVLNDAFGPFSESEAADILKRILVYMKGRTVVVIGRKIETALPFDMIVSCEGSRLKLPERDGADNETGDVTVAKSEAVENAELDALRSVALFAGLDLANLKLLAFTSERISFRSGETLFREGDDADVAYTIISGAAMITVASQTGPITISTVGAKEIVGEMGIITGEPRSATVTATSDLVALRIRKEVFLALLAQFPAMALAVTQLMVKRLQQNVSTVNRHFRQNADER